MPTPMPSETVTAITLRKVSAWRPNQISASAQAFAAFSSSTGNPVARVSGVFKSRSRHSRLGANTSLCECASTRPGRLTPMPSKAIPGCDWISSTSRRPNRARNCDAVPSVGSEIWAMTLVSNRANMIVVVTGRRSTPTMPARSMFKWRKVGLRPRGRWPTAPSTTQRSAMSSSVIEETVLRCRPE